MKKIILLIFVLSITGVFFAKNIFQANAKEKNTYRQVSQEEASKIMETEKDYIILDVRTKEEFAEGYIKGAISVPNETIGKSDIPKLPNKEQLILVYCRSGNRSKQAAQKLANIGYTNVVEFGGIGTWKGEIVK